MTDTIDIDSRTYIISELSAAAREQINNVQVTDQEIARLQMRLAIAQTARTAYAKALRAELNTSTEAQDA